MDAGPWGFRAYAVLLWPDGPAAGRLLLSLKTMNRDGNWTEFLPSPQKLSKYVPPLVDFSLLPACMPQVVADAPGAFYELSGRAPLNWHRMENGGEATVELHQLPPGAVALKWTGALRGLLVLGRIG